MATKIFDSPFKEYDFSCTGGVVKVNIFSRDENNQPIEFSVSRIDENVLASNGSSMGGHFIENVHILWNGPNQYIYFDGLKADAGATRDKWNYVYLTQKGTGKTIRLLLVHHFMLEMVQQNIDLNYMQSSSSLADYPHKVWVQVMSPGFLDSLHCELANGVTYPPAFFLETPFDKSGNISLGAPRRLSGNLWEIEVTPTRWDVNYDTTKRPRGLYNTNLICATMNKGHIHESHFVLRCFGYRPF
ncbi:MAG: hypothetical protein LUH22_10605 [Bacteroides sp.]|nr:hypothetical protein [Bacteroides sp.]